MKPSRKKIEVPVLSERREDFLKYYKGENDYGSVSALLFDFIVAELPKFGIDVDKINFDWSPFHEIIKNAYDAYAMRPEGLKIGESLSLEVVIKEHKQHKGNVIVKIKDSGAGFIGQPKSKPFHTESVVRAEKTGQGLLGGQGVGLNSFTVEIRKSGRGEVYLKNRKGPGAALYMQFAQEEHALQTTAADRNETQKNAEKKALFDAAKNGQIQRISNALTENASEVLQQVNAEGNALLHVAIQYGHIDIVKALLKAGANFYQLGKKGISSLFLGIKYGQEAMVEMLAAEYPTSVHEADKDGNSSLHIAAQHGQVKMLNILLAAGAEVNKKNRLGKTPLHTAAEHGNTAATRALLTEIAVNAIDRNGQTPLHLAATSGNTGVIACLLEEKGIAIDQTDKWGNTPLLAAAGAGQAETVAMLLVAHHDAINTANHENITPLIAAVQEGHTEVVHVLLEANAAVDTLRADGKTALHLAAEEGQLEICEALLAKNANLEQADTQGITPLLAAVQKGHTAVVHALWEAGAEIQQAQEYLKTQAKDSIPKDMQQLFDTFALIEKLDNYIKQEGGKKPSRFAFLPPPLEKHMAEARELLLALREKDIDLSKLPSAVVQTLQADAEKGGVLGKIYQEACTLSQAVEAAASPKIR